jgi:TonB-linked SusC/RagA family outer membrane protein
MKKIKTNLSGDFFIPGRKYLRIMKLTFIFVLWGLISYASATYSQSTRLTFESNEATIESVFKQIESLSEFKFAYNSSKLDVGQKISVKADHEAIDVILDKILGSTDFQYKIVDRYIIISDENLKSPLTLGSEQLAKSVSGKVTDSTGATLPGVSVVVKGTTIGVITDANGSYSLPNIPANTILQFSFVGMKMQGIMVGNKTTINVSLAEETVGIEEVVAVGYGKQSKRLVTGAIQSVNGEQISDLPVNTAAQKLQGKLAGVQINQTTGRPGQGLQVRVRGSASISTNSSPLIVIDGFPITGNLSSINPDEIESISVLKDASSTALYGSRAAFGVVLITTKAAKLGQTIIRVNVFSGIQSVPQKGRPDMMNGTEYAQLRKEAYEDKGLAVPAAFQNPEQYGEGYDWYDAMLRTGKISNYNVTLSTSKEKFSSSIVGSYSKQEGVMLNSSYDRYSIRANTSYQLAGNLKVGLNLAPSVTIDKSLPSDGTFNGGEGAGLLFNALLTQPILPYKNEDGSLPVSVTNKAVSNFAMPNWIRSAKEIKSQTDSYYILSSAFLEYEPIKSLIMKSTFNIENGQSQYNFFQPSTASVRFNQEPSQIMANMVQTNSHYYSWLNENTATYSKKIYDHSFDVLAGYTVQKYKMDNTNIRGSNYTDDRIQTIDAALVKATPTMDIQEWSLISYLGRLNYNYKGKYVFGASIRRDGSSRFGADNKWGNFPALSMGWVASEESFLNGTKNWLSFLKIRGSYGVTGNNNIGNYTQFSTVSNSNVVFGSTTTSGVAVTGLGNADLGWETTNQLDLGADLNLFNNRVSIAYDYYLKKTSNLLLAISVPQESGFSSIQSNVGEIKFWGHEIDINTKNLVGNFKWNTNFNIAFSDNKVLSLSSLTNTIYSSTWNAVSITKVGGRIGQFWGLIQDGVYVNQADYDASPKSINSQVGTIKFRDVNKDGVIKYGNDEGDRAIIGNPFPKFIFGLSNDFSYKNFDLSVVMSGSYGNDIARMTDQGTANLDLQFNVLKEVKNRWRSPENPGDGKFGKMLTGKGEERTNFHTGEVFDGSYLAIKNITLGYNIPVKNNKTFGSVRIYSSIQQAYVFTHYTGGNPEVSTTDTSAAPNSLNQGLDISAYPIPRTISFGLNVNFK